MGKKDYSNLRDKTILDICSDEQILNEILPFVPYGIDKKQFYIGYYKCNAVCNALAMLEVADLTKDADLRTAVKRQFKKELELFYNE